jgi:hypothetical protein
MPAVSDAQRRWAFGNKGAAWAREHHFDTKGSLPARSTRKKHKKGDQRQGDRRQRLVAQFVRGQQIRGRHG